MLRYVTAGESHGRGLLAILDGMVSGLALSPDDIDRDLARRQKGYGRGGRMAIEKDRVEILSGVRRGKTIGAPISLLIMNKDYRPDYPLTGKFILTSPRPGHADLAGVLKFNEYDLTNIAERASARETAARVAVGAICRRFLRDFGVRIVSWVSGTGGIPIAPVKDPLKAFACAEASELRSPDRSAEKKMRAKIQEAIRKGDTVGGNFDVAALGVPAGLGSYAQWDMRLDGRLAQALMSIQAIKAVEIGQGIKVACGLGSKAHDEIFYEKGRFCRRTNYAGGLEGGVTNGENLIVRAFMKPISTLGRPLRSVDIVSKKPTRAEVIRHDVCAVPAASIVGESAVAFELARAFLEKFGGDSLGETKRNFRAYLAQLKRF